MTTDTPKSAKPDPGHAAHPVSATIKPDHHDTAAPGEPSLWEKSWFSGDNKYKQEKRDLKAAKKAAEESAKARKKQEVGDGGFKSFVKNTLGVVTEYGGSVFSIAALSYVAIELIGSKGLNFLGGIVGPIWGEIKGKFNQVVDAIPGHETAMAGGKAIGHKAGEIGHAIVDSKVGQTAIGAVADTARGVGNVGKTLYQGAQNLDHNLAPQIYKDAPPPSLRDLSAKRGIVEVSPLPSSTVISERAAPKAQTQTASTGPATTTPTGP